MFSTFVRGSRRAVFTVLAACAAVWFGGAVPAAAQSFRVAPTLQTHIHPNSAAFADFNGDGLVDMAVTQYEYGLTVYFGNGQGGFAEGPTYQCGTPRTSIARDINGDGRADVVVSDEHDAVWVFIGTGASGLQAGVRYAAGDTPYSVSMADVNEDGHDDLVTANANGGTISVLFGDGAGHFSAQVQYAVGTTPRSVAIADFNSDGHLDLAVGNYGSDTVSLLLGDGTGTFGGAVVVATGSQPYLITAGDLNSDGHADLVVPNYGNGTVGIFYGNGLGQFGPGLSIATGQGPRQASITDINEDGHMDLIVTNRDASSLSVLIGNGAGGFQAPRTYGVGSGPFFTTRLDLDGDGRRELVVVNRDAFTISFFKGDDTGVLAAPVPLLVGSGPRGIAAADFDGDGTQDLALPSYYQNALKVLHGNGDGTATTAATLTTQRSPWNTIAADVDSNGTPDIAVVNSGQNSVSVYRNLGGGTFAAARSFAAGTGPTALAAADFNRDGRLDIITANSSAGTVAVLSGDGTGGFSAPVARTVGTAPVAIAVADFNSDGKADAAVVNNGSSNMTILLGDGAGGFSSAVNVATAAKPAWVTAADFNNDTAVDLAVVSTTGNTVTIFTGNGAGGFTAFRTYATGLTPLSVAAADLDGDGILDLVTANAGADTVSVFRGLGTGEFGPGRAYGVGIYPRALALADFDGDGRIDIGVGNANSNDAWILVNTSGHGDLAVAITDGVGQISPGQRVRYTMTVTNLGPSDVGQAPVTAAFPAGSSDIQWTCVAAGGAACAPAGAGSVGDLAFLPVAGVATYTVDVTLPASVSGSVAAQASVTMPASDDPNLSNNVAVDTDSVLSNHAPVAQDRTASTNEDASVAITIAATDVDGDPLTWTVTGQPAHGTLSGTAPALTYTPAANFNGTDSLTFQVNDGHASSNLGTVSITVAPVNDAPTATAASVSTPQDVAIAVNLTGGDIDGDALSYLIGSGPSHGTLSGSGAARTYTPATGYSGPDSFTFSTFDGQANSSLATVSITVTKTNHPPVLVTPLSDLGVVDDSTEVFVNASGTFADPDLADGDVLTLSVTGNTNAALAAPSFTGATLRVGLAAGVSGSSTIRVRATDSHGLFVEDEFVVTVTRPPLNVTIADATVVEGNSGTRSLTFNLTLSSSPITPVTVTFASADGTATAGADYAAVSGSVTFNAGVTARTIVVPAIGDTIDEPDETVLMRLTGATGAAISRSEAVGTIVNDDTSRVSIADVTVTEGTGGSPVATFQLTLSLRNSRTVTVDVATANSTAIAGADYTATTGTVTFAPGAQAATFSVPIVGDALDEANEKFTLSIVGLTNAAVQRGTGTATLVDDDDPPTVTIDDVTVTEANASTVATFTLHLSAPSGLTTRVQFATANGTAVAGSDFRSGSGTVTFAPGATTAVVNVVLLADRIAEPTETFVVNLSAPTLLVIGRAQATGTILDDDGGTLP